MKRTIYLVDPAGGGIEQSPGLIVVKHKILEAVDEIEMESEKVTNPGELRVTPAAYKRLEWHGVKLAFLNHLSANWFSTDEEECAELDEQLHCGWVIYNVGSTQGIMMITYPGDNTTLITSEEY